MNQLKFERVIQNRGSVSNVWTHFQRSTDKKFVKCEKCDSQLGYNTTGMREHLKRKHAIEIEPKDMDSGGKSSMTTPSAHDAGESSRDVPVKKPQTLILDFTHKVEDVDFYCAQMAAIDNITFKTIATSNFIRKAMLALTHEALPKSPNSVKQSFLVL